MSKFKVGDLVYCPAESIKIRRLSLWGDDSKLSVINFPVTETGYLCSDDDEHSATPFIVHATQENYELLSKLYPNVAFEPPPKRKEPKEIIKAMLQAGYDGVPCKTECGRDRYICTGIVEDEFYSFQYDNDEDNAYSSGIPYHPKTRQKIIDFVDGEVILESEND